MARINWNNSAPYEHILGKKTGEKIYTIMEHLGVKHKQEALRFAVEFACMELIDKPFKPAEPERKKGEWVEYPDCLRYEGAYADDQIVCSECHHVFSILDNCTEEFDFCPKCGADMRGENG